MNPIFMFWIISRNPNLYVNPNPNLDPNPDLDLKLDPTLNLGRRGASMAIVARLRGTTREVPQGTITNLGQQGAGVAIMAQLRGSPREFLPDRARSRRSLGADPGKFFRVELRTWATEGQEWRPWRSLKTNPGISTGWNFELGLRRSRYGDRGIAPGQKPVSSIG